MPTLQSHTYRIRTMPPADQKCGKSVPVPSQTEMRSIREHLEKSKTTSEQFQNIFSHPSKKIKTPDTQTNPTKTVKLNSDNGLQTRTTERQLVTAVLQKWRWSASYDSEVVNQNLVLRLKFSGENRHLRKAANR
jgi:hypothetical protein